MPYSFEKVCTSYSIEITDQLFLSLLRSESAETGNAAYQAGNQTLAAKLDRIPGVSDIEYDGHFGPAVFVTISSEEDTEQVKGEIIKTIKDHLIWCKKLKRK